MGKRYLTKQNFTDRGKMDKENLKEFKYIVVGAGLFGSIIAERISHVLNKKVLLLEKRDHIGGNCYSETEAATGIECHRYGSHIFHTHMPHVWDYITTFIRFNHYQHKVYTTCRNKVYPMPINLWTLNSFYNLNLKPDEVDAFLSEEVKKENIVDPKNFEEKAIVMVGRPLYEAFIKGYTVKQWDMDPRNLPADILKRIPFRKNYDNDYFGDPFQGIPEKGYTNIFNELLKNEKISVELNTDYFDLKKVIPPDALVIYTGPIDRFFDYKHGVLGWRTLTLETEVLENNNYQGTSVMNYADMEIPYTRIHEFKHLHPEKDHTGGTVIVREYARKAGRQDDPYYPVHTKEDDAMYDLYAREADNIPNVIFGGRLGTYCYLDMDDVIDRALRLFDERIKNDASFG